MKTRLLTALVLSSVIFLSATLAEETEVVDISKYVTELDHSSYNNTVDNNNVFLEFYTQWCGHCKALDKVLVETAQTLNNPKVVFAKMDAGEDNNKEYAQQLSVDSYPTFFYVTNGQYVLYSGSKSTEGFTKFLRKELNPDITKYRLNYTLSDINTLANEKKGLLVFVGDNTVFLNEFKSNKRIADNFKRKIRFVWTNAEEFHRKFGIPLDKYGLVYFNFVYDLNRFSDGSLIELNVHLELKSVLKMIVSPIFENADANLLHKYLEQSVSSLILIHNDSHPENLNSPTNRLMNSLIPILEHYRSEFYIHKMDWADENLGPIYDNFELNDTQIPTFIMISVNKDHEINKYKMNETITPESLSRFLTAYKANNLERLITSEAVPEETVNSFNVVKLVRKTLNKTVFDNNNDEFFVLYCTDSSDICEDARERFNNISLRFNKSKNVVFAEYDINLNENDIIDVGFIPDLIYFPASIEGKVSGMKRFSGNYTSNEILAFVTQNANPNNLVATPLENEEAIWKNETDIEQRKLSEDEEIREKQKDIEEEEEHENEEGHGEDSHTNTTETHQHEEGSDDGEEHQEGNQEGNHEEAQQEDHHEENHEDNNANSTPETHAEEAQKVEL